MRSDEATKIIEKEKRCVLTDCERPECKNCGLVMDTGEILEALDMAISALKKQEEDRWIPVKERLPEKSGTYLITENNHIKDKNVCSAMYHITDIYGCYWSGGDCGIGKVLAWRPLPEAYTEEDNE